MKSYFHNCYVYLVLHRELAWLNLFSFIDWKGQTFGTTEKIYSISIHMEFQKTPEKEFLLHGISIANLKIDESQMIKVRSCAVWRFFKERFRKQKLFKFIFSFPRFPCRQNPRMDLKYQHLWDLHFVVMMLELLNHMNQVRFFKTRDIKLWINLMKGFSLIIFFHRKRR